MRSTRSAVFSSLAILLLATASIAAQQAPAPAPPAPPPTTMGHPMEPVVPLMQGEMSCSDSGAGHDMGNCKKMAREKMMERMRSMMPPPSGAPMFDAIGAQVAMLDADSTTDWSQVNLEELRQHLIDMNDLMMNAVVAPKPVSGGVELTITGTGRTVGAIQRMVVDHMAMLQKSGKYVTAVTNGKTGVVAMVTAPAPATDRAVARIRGLGFAGLMTEGTHHVRHHGAMARGDSLPHAH